MQPIRTLTLATLLLLPMVSLADESMSEPQTPAEWDTSKSFEFTLGDFLTSAGRFVVNIPRAFLPRRPVPTESTSFAAAQWPSRSVVDTYRNDSGMFKYSGASRYLEFLSDEEGFIETIRVAGHLDDDLNVVNEETYGAEKPAIYGQHPWFFPDGPFVYDYRFHKRFSVRRLYVSRTSVVLYDVVDDDDETAEIKGDVVVLGRKMQGRKRWVTEIEEYRRKGFERMKNDQVALAEAEKVFRSEHSLENRPVTDIRAVIVDGLSGESAPAGGVLRLGLEVTFADGTTDKTHNLGGNLYVNDFTSESRHVSSGGPYRLNEFDAHCHCGDLEVEIPRGVKPGQADTLSFTVVSRYEGSGSYTGSFPIAYPEHFELALAGGATHRIAVKSSKHSETGEPLAHMLIGRRFYKMKADGRMHLSAIGQVGRSGREGEDCRGQYCHAGNGTDGGPGGPGGNLYVTRSADLDALKISLTTSGGPGGSGGAPGVGWDGGTNGHFGRQGPRGPSGNHSITVGTVTF